MGEREGTLFLDFDGVMNSRAWLKKVAWEHKAEATTTKWSDAKGATLDWWASMVDPAKVEILNRLTDDTGAWIAVSSSWRSGLKMDGLKALFEKVGITGRFAGHTENLWDFGRGSEIAEFLYGLVGGTTREQHVASLAVQRIVIIDDEPSEMRCLRARVVQTTMETGMTERHAAVARKMLAQQVGPKLADRLVSLAVNTRRRLDEGKGHHPFDTDSAGNPKA